MHNVPWQESKSKNGNDLQIRSGNLDPDADVHQASAWIVCRSVPRRLGVFCDGHSVVSWTPPPFHSCVLKPGSNESACGVAPFPFQRKKKMQDVRHQLNKCSVENEAEQCHAET